MSAMDLVEDSVLGRDHELVGWVDIYAHVHCSSAA